MNNPYTYDRDLYIAADFKICFRMKDSDGVLLDPDDFHITFRAANDPGHVLIFDYSTQTGSEITSDSDGIVTVKITAAESEAARFTKPEIYYEIDTVHKVTGEDIRRIIGFITINQTLET